MVNTELRAPKAIAIDAPFVDNWLLDNDYPITMRWNAYADNPLGVVYIGVFYEGDYANANDGVRVAPGTYLVEVYEVPDNGTYSIPQSIYNHLPVGVRCSIFVGRVNGTELVDAQTGLSTAIHAVALDKKELMVVVD